MAGAATDYERDIANARTQALLARLLGESGLFGLADFPNNPANRISDLPNQLSHTVLGPVRVMGGEDPAVVAGELGVTVTDLSLWKDKFIKGGIEGIKRRAQDESQELQELRAYAAR
jgi:hypothetical protein